MKLCASIVLVMTIIMVYSLVNAIPSANYDVKYITTIAEGTPL